MCPLREHDEASVLGKGGCLRELNCKGPRTYADCPSRRWNSPGNDQNGVSFCMLAGGPCIGCTEPNFPDGMSPFYGRGSAGGGGDD